MHYPSPVPHVLLVGKKIELTATGKPTRGSPRSQVVIHFDQRNEQDITDSGQKDGQDLTSPRFSRGGNFVNKIGFVDTLDAGRFR
jgi:hypothetical protein